MLITDIFFILQTDVDDTISLDDDEANEDIKVEEVFVKSTKRPTKQGGKGPTKKNKVEAAENNLLQMAIDAMSKSERDTADGFDKFADYVASELRAITSKQLQGWAKLQIQTILYNCHMQQSGQQSPTAPATPNMDPFSQRYPPSSPLYYQPHPQSTVMVPSPSASDISFTS